MVFINGVNIGRYWSIGPQRTLYVPAPILKSGLNRVCEKREGKEEGEEGEGEEGEGEEGEGGDGGRRRRRDGSSTISSYRSSYLRCFSQNDLRLSVLLERLFWTSQHYLGDFIKPPYVFSTFHVALSMVCGGMVWRDGVEDGV